MIGSKNSAGVNLRIPENLRKWLNGKAEDKRVKVSQIVREILFEKFDSESVSR